MSLRTYTLFPAAVLALACTSIPSNRILSPDLAVGRQLHMALSEELHVPGGLRRTSGTFDLRVTGKTGDRYAFVATLHFGGRSVSANGTVDPLAHAVSLTSGDEETDGGSSGVSAFFESAFWGSPPPALSVGEHWTVALSKPWTNGPAGSQTVTVTALDCRNDAVTLTAVGSGTGPTASQLEHPPETTAHVEGRVVHLPSTYGPSTWKATVTLRHGITQEEHLVVRQLVKYGATDVTPAHSDTQELDLTLTRIE